MRLDHKLPKGWHMAKLGEVADVDWGNTSLTKSSYADTGFTAFSATGPDGFMNSFEHDEDAVVLSAIGANCGKCFFATGKWTAIKNTIVIRPKGNLLPSFFFYISNQPRFWRIRGAAQPFISLGDSRSLQIPLPPLPTQHKIVEILDAADMLRRKRREADEKMKQLIPAIFVKMFGDPATNPMGWELKEFQELGEVFSGATPSTKKKEYWDGDINWVTPAELNDDSFLINESQRKITREGYESCSAKLFSPGTVLLSCRAPIGKVAIADTEICTNQGFKSLSPKEDMLHSYYLYWWLKQQGNYLQSLGVGATFKEISGARFKKIKIPVPTIDLQKEFTELVDDLQHLRNNTQVQNKNISKIFETLLCKAFRGELVS